MGRFPLAGTADHGLAGARCGEGGRRAMALNGVQWRVMTQRTRATDAGIGVQGLGGRIYCEKGGAWREGIR